MSLRSVLALALLAAPKLSLADTWLVAEAPAAVPVSGMQEGVFKTGFMPAIGAYADNGQVALGLRLRAGVLRNGAAPTGASAGIADPSTGGLITASVALRVHHRGLWAEVAGGGGFTGSDAVPAVELGAGYDFTAGDFAVGPGVRYVDVIARDPMSTLGSAQLLLVGLDVQWGGSHARPAHASRVAVEAAAPVAPLEVVAASADHDRVVDRDTSCAERLDGCPISKHLTITNDRIVLDERVLFDTDQARVRSGGRELIAEVATAWRQHPEWKRITVEGHCDERGTDAYNQALSERRAQNARDVLLLAGFSPDSIEAIGYGRSRPRAAGTSPEALQHNRRVEFLIDREVAK